MEMQRSHSNSTQIYLYCLIHTRNPQGNLISGFRKLFQQSEISPKFVQKSTLQQPIDYT